MAAADWLNEVHQAPTILIGHSLRGAVVLRVAPRIEAVRAVVTIGAPCDPEHVTHNFHAHLDEIEETGAAVVEFGRRSFRINKQFLDDIAEHSMRDVIGDLRKPVPRTTAAPPR